MYTLSCSDLAIGYEKNILIEDICLGIEEGEIAVLVGPNGSGKTTIIKTLSGILAPINGKIYLDQREFSEIPLNERAKKISVMLTEKKEYDYTSVFDVIAVGRYPYTNVMGKLGENDISVIDSVIEEVGIEDIKDKSFNKLSDGQRQKVLLARALVQEPSVLVLDEPTSFLDVGSKLEFMKIIRRLTKTKKISVLMSLHELDLAYAIADTIISVTKDHRIEKKGAPKDVLTKEYIAKLFNLNGGSYSLSGGFSFNEDEKACINVESEQCNEKGFEMKNKTHFIMVQGTMSNAGKSLVVAGLCRIFKEDGYRVSPFKSQNMALNSYITEDGLEMGRAQVMQAEAAGIKPDVHMNPILLKPTDDVGSQVIVNGEVRGNMRAREYFEYKKTLIPDIMNAVSYLSKDNDIIVIEGAGSPAEINLKENDIVNMGMAKMVDAPVILVGDIDRGGVFAQLLGTLELLEEDERKRVKGLVVNKFRGDKSLLDSGIDMLSERGKVPVVGVIPYMDVKLEDEDSLTERFNKKSKGLIDIAVIRLPHISNFTDFDVFEELREVSLRYVSSAKELEDADLIMIPGSKNTISDMKWLRENGFEGVLKKLSDNQKPIFGICGGYQMLGLDIEDKDSVEAGGFIKGLGLLDIHTVMKREKERKQVAGTIPCLGGPLGALSNLPYEGYEIHMGVSSKKMADGEVIPGEKLADIENTSSKEFRSEEVVAQKGSVYGTYIHGIFDRKEVVKAIIDTLAENKKVDINTEEYQDYRAFKESQYTKLSKIMREHLDMDAIYEMMDLRK